MSNIINTIEAGFDNRIMFHFNKHHLIDSTTPMWVVKMKGTTYYVNHLDSKVGFSTKETPEHESTKGALKFKGNLTIKEYDDKTSIATIE